MKAMNRQNQTRASCLNVRQILLYVILPICTGITFWYIGHCLELPSDSICYEDFGLNATMCRPRCPPQYFSLPGMQQCEPWLTCHDLESSHFKIGELIGQGAVKMVYLSEWLGRPVVLNTLIVPEHRDDFVHGLSMLQGYQGHTRVTQLLGHCGDRYVTEYHRLGSAKKLTSTLQTDPYRSQDTVQNRLGICVQYVEIIALLHHDPLGTRVMCDSNDLEKTLSQYLLRGDLHLVANDLDALPVVDHSAGQLIKCGQREITGDFPAPEQLWPHDDLDFSDDNMPPYDEKSDIWKIPDVCDHFLGHDQGSDTVRFHLFKIHKQCKAINVTLRPTAIEILTTYRELQTRLNS